MSETIETEKRIDDLDALKAEMGKRLGGLFVERKDGSRVPMEDYLFESLARRIAHLKLRNAELEQALKYLIKQGKYPRSLSGSDDCGDHCSNSCPWCEARAALEVHQP